MSKTRIAGSITKNSADQTVLHVTDGSFNSGAAGGNEWHGISKGITEHNYVSEEKETDEEEEVLINGFFYNIDGTYEGKADSKKNTGNATDVYTCTGKEAVKDKDGKDTDVHRFCDPVLLKEGAKEITHLQFCYICFVVKAEAGGSDLEELKCIAFASHNRAVKLKVTWKALLGTGYSSVPAKTEMSKDLKDTKSKLTRQAVFSVLKREEDLTKGAEFWDGTDFLAWGDSELNPYNKVGQNKFDEYKFVEIPKEVYDDFVAANGTSTRYSDKGNHDLKNDSGTHEHTTVKKTRPAKDAKGQPVFDKNKKRVMEEYEVPYLKYNLPATDFKDASNWTSGSFYYETKSKSANGISGTITAGKSIFWKLTPTRLTSATPTAQ